MEDEGLVGTVQDPVDTVQDPVDSGSGNNNYDRSNILRNHIQMEDDPEGMV